MSLLTLELIGLLLAAWKAPAWVKEAGLIALLTGIFGTVVGLHQMTGVLHEMGPMSPNIIFGGLHVSLTTTAYGMLIYGVSLIIRIIQKPRI